MGADSPAGGAGAEEALATLRALAIPRLHGSPGAERVGAEVRLRLERLGYDVEDRPFEFSGWPARHGVPVLGLSLMATFAGSVGLRLTGHAPAATLLLLAPLALAAALLAFMDAFVMRAPWGRRSGVNLVATSGPEPGFLVVAHRDSKSQPVPLAIRLGAVIVALGAWVAAIGGAVTGAVLTGGGLLAAGLGIWAGAVLALCGVANESPGALDNASGLATLLRVAELEHGAGDVAFLVSDAEELGLAGARAAVRRSGRPAAVINLDGLDDEGPFFLVRGTTPWAGPGGPLERAFQQAGAASDQPVRQRGVPPGLMLDHIPFARAGIPALTLMRGRLRSLARVHRPADRADRMNGSGAAGAAALVSAALGRLRAGSEGGASFGEGLS